ncbi:phage/plasmid primase, P4 family [Candidatus Poribacteria bacterium]
MTIKIPKQLRNKKFRFVRLEPQGKAPIDKEWQTKNNFEYNHPYFMNYLKMDCNYGVCGGYGNLVIIDCDVEEVKDAVEQNLPETFTVQTGSGKWHFYYICSDMDASFRLTNTENDDKTLGDVGDVQSYGKQVVGPGSVHPKTGNRYEVIKDVPISTVDKEQIQKTVAKWIASEQKFVVRKDVSGEQQLSIVDIDITKVIDVSKLQQRSAIEYQGAHPIHGSGTGNNFHVNIGRNIWHCFRHGTGGDALTWVAVKEGIIECHDAVHGALKGEKYKEAAKLAKEKYDIEYINMDELFVQHETQVEASWKYGMEQYIKTYLNKLDMAEKFYEIQPFFYDKARIWWIWDKNRYCWEMVDETDIMNQVDVALTGSGTDTVKASTKGEIIEALKRVGRLHVPKKIEKTWVQFNRKIVDIETGEEFESTPEYFATNPIPWEIGEVESTPNMDRIFTEWVGEKYVQTLYEIIAYCLLPSYPIHRLFCLNGAGMNGKSKYLDLIVKFLGTDNCCSTSLDMLMTSRFELSRLYRKTLCTMGETNFTSLRKTERLKKLTGEDLIGFEFKNKDPFDDYNYAKIVIATNTIPITHDKTTGFYRRWFIIDFPNQFTEGKDILSEIHDIEYENLARKCIRILQGLVKRRKFTNDEDVEMKKKRYEEKSNPMKMFIQQRCVSSPGGYIQFSEFRDLLNGFLKENGYRELNATELGLYLKDEGYEKKRQSIKISEGNYAVTTCIMGIQWKKKEKKSKGQRNLLSPSPLKTTA